MFKRYVPETELLSDIDEYDNLRGLEAVIFGVKSEHRKSITAYKLYSEIIKLDYDYIIIEQAAMYEKNFNYLNKAKNVIEIGEHGSIYIIDVKK